MHRRLPSLSSALALLLLPTGLLLFRCGDDDGASPDADLTDAGTRCGNGRVDPGEECDDGNDDNNDGCCTTCLYCDLCNAEYWDQCTPGETVCCPSREDRPTTCAAPTGDATARCLLSCLGESDCYWHSACDDAVPGACYPVYCGPQESLSPVNAPCPSADGTGFCYPQSYAESDSGLCIQPGTLPAGARCESGHYLDEIPRSLPICDGGLCTTWTSPQQPQCLAFCDPVAAYDATPHGGSECPTGTNCLNFAYVSTYSFRRLSDKGLCIPDPTADPSGLWSCDLLTGQLIQDRLTTCADALPGSTCGIYRTGSLMGTCQTLGATPLGLGAPCDVEDATGLVCQDGLSCLRDDPFGDPGDLICTQLCDAQDPSFTCAGAGLVCTSYSHTGDADPPDSSPSRLGLCALPPAE